MQRCCEFKGPQGPPRDTAPVRTRVYYSGLKYRIARRVEWSLSCPAVIPGAFRSPRVVPATLAVPVPHGAKARSRAAPRAIGHGRFRRNHASFRRATCAPCAPNRRVPGRPVARLRLPATLTDSVRSGFDVNGPLGMTLYHPASALPPFCREAAAHPADAT